ncbi:MAG TPA: hypothetical protein VFH52_05735 [Rhodanobacteraceae bacterium]|nr:hypothetical protein [Rhodanobacteraceae bacterium]
MTELFLTAGNPHRMLIAWLPELPSMAKSSVIDEIVTFGFARL